jgi:hypothetical protein
VTAPGEPLRRLPVPVRLIARETIGSFLTRLALANSLRIPHMLALTAISKSLQSFSPATDDTRGWSESTPARIAALAGRALAELASAIPLLATMTPPATAPLHACRHCAAAKNITGMVIIRASPRDYLCTRHQQWLRGIHRPSLAALPEVAESQRRHNRHTMDVPDQDIARAHRQAQDITGQWLAAGWHPALTGRWQDRHRRLTAAIPGPEVVLADVITHPEMLAVARLLTSGQRTAGIRPQEIVARLGFPYPGSPHPLDPLQNHLSQLPRAEGGVMAIDIPARLRDEDLATCLVKRYLAPDPATGRARYSGAYFERIGGGGDRPEIAGQFTAEDLLAVTMLSVRIEGYHALEILRYRARELDDLLAQIPRGVALQDPQARTLIAEGGPAWRLWDAICDIEPRPESNRIGPVAAGKLLARKRPDLLPVYDSRIKKVLSRPRTDNRWWHDLRDELTNNQGLVQELERVRDRAGAGHMSLLRIFDVMCWMFSWEGDHGPCSQEMPD